MRGLPAGDTARPWEHQAVACGQGVEAQAESHDSVFREADAMTEPLERPHSVLIDIAECGRWGMPGRQCQCAGSLRP
jgi:hypothetical protein